MIVAVDGLSRLGRACRVKVHIIRDEEIEMAIEVVVQKAAARTPATATPRDAGFFGHVRKGSIAVVMIQNVATPVADEQIVVAVVVVVADGRAHPVEDPLQARLARHVAKAGQPVRTVPLVPVECERRPRGFRARIVGPVGAGDEEQITGAVVAFIFAIA